MVRKQIHFLNYRIICLGAPPRGIQLRTRHVRTKSVEEKAGFKSMTSALVGRCSNLSVITRAPLY